MELGCRAHDFGKLPLAGLAKKIAGAGFSSTQLAWTKAIADTDSSRDTIDPDLPGRIAAAFRGAGVRVAVLGSYFNPVHPDPAERARGVGRFNELLRLGGSMGCRIVATETGSLAADFSSHPDNGSESVFALFIETMREVVAEAGRRGSTACIEGVARHVIRSPARMRRALDELGSPSVQVLFDPVNFLDADNYRHQDCMIEESFELFGDRIVVVHAKDFAVKDGKLAIVPAGSGFLDYARLFRLLKARKPDIDVLLEDIRPESMPGAMDFVREAWEKA